MMSHCTELRMQCESRAVEKPQDTHATQEQQQASLMLTTGLQRNLHPHCTEHLLMVCPKSREACKI